MKQINLTALFYNLAIALLFTAVAAPFMGVNSLIIGTLLFSLGFVKRTSPVGILRTEVITTIFSSDLQKNLYPANEFYKGAKVDTGVAINAIGIDVPQAGTPPNVVKNPTTLPIPARVRADDKKSYLVDLYATEPDIVTDVNQAIAAYDKRAAILADHSDTLNTRIADELVYLWSPSQAANIKRTSGANNTGSTAGAMTGVRKEITLQDIIDVATLMDRMNVPDDGQRRVLFYTDQIAELKKIPEFRDYDKTGIVGNLANGALGKIQNINVYKRSKAPLFTSGLVKKAVGSAIASTDFIGAIFFHPSYVRYAEGNVQVYYEAKKVGYQGDMMNAAVRGGGMISRLDEVGVVALIQQ